MQIKEIVAKDSRKVTLSLGNQRNGIQTHDGREFGIELHATLDDGDNYAQCQKELDSKVQEFLDSKMDALANADESAFHAFVAHRTEAGVAHAYPQATEALSEPTPRPASPKPAAKQASFEAPAPVPAEPAAAVLTLLTPASTFEDGMDLIMESLTSAKKPYEVSKLKDELQKYLDYGVPLDQAARSLLRSYGASPPAASPQTKIPAATATTGGKPVGFIGTLKVGDEKIPKFRAYIKDLHEFEYSKGKGYKFTLKDKSGTILVTFFGRAPAVGAGDVVDVEGAWKVSEYQGQLQLDTGKYCKMTRVTDASPGDF